MYSSEILDDEDDEDPVHEAEEKERIEALLSGKVKPFNEFESHFLDVVAGVEDCNSFRERQWILYVFDTRHKREPYVWQVPDLGSPQYEGFHVRRFELLSSYAFMLQQNVESCTADRVFPDEVRDGLEWLDNRLVEGTLEELQRAMAVQKDFERRYGEEYKRLNDIFIASDRDLLNWEIDMDPDMHRSMDRPPIDYARMLGGLDADCIRANRHARASALADMAVAQGIEPIPGKITNYEDDDAEPF